MTGPETTRQRVIMHSPLMDLPEGRLISILKHLPFQAKCQSQGVCRTLRAILRNPAIGSLVWGCVNLEDAFFKTASPPALARQAAHHLQTLALHSAVCLAMQSSLLLSCLLPMACGWDADAVSLLHELCCLAMQVAHPARAWHQDIAI